jgi:hypothetical protein
VNGDGIAAQHQGDEDMFGIRMQWFGAAALALALTACSTHSIKYKNPTAAGGGTVHSERQSFFLWGLVGGSEIDLAQVCPSGVARIEDRNSFGDQLFAMFTGGLYSPRSVEIECVGGTAAVIEGVPADQVARLTAAAQGER